MNAKPDSVAAAAPAASAAPAPPEAPAAPLTPLDQLLQNAVNSSRNGDAKGAIRYCHHALILAPDEPRALHLLGVFCSEYGDLGEAMSLLRRALKLAPGFVMCRLNLGLILLRAGLFAEGWPLYEDRLKLNNPKARQRVVLPKLSYPRWKGEDVRGKRVLLVREQGFGDQLQFARYAQILAERGAEVDLLVRPQLVKILSTAPGVRHAYHEEPTEPDRYDFWLPIMSAPLFLGGGAEAIPRQVPYVTPDPVAVESWRERLDEFAAGRRKIGLMWGGNAGHVKDFKRSINFTHLAPLFRVPGLAFISFQLGEPAKQAAAAFADGSLLDLGPSLSGFEDTAAIAQSVDVMISVDTAIAHLFGAAGRPVWTLLAQDCDWRWMRYRDDTLWYPTMRLFRQAVAEKNMSGVIDRVAAALVALG